MLTIVKPAYALTWSNNCIGTNVNNGSDVATIRGIECLVNNLFLVIPSLMAFAAVTMIIMAGIKLITAGADPKAYAAAWQQLTWAVVGLILLSAVWLVLVIIEKTTGAQVTKFGFPQ